MNTEDITQVTNITLLRSARADRDRQQGLNDAQWLRIKHAKQRLGWALNPATTENMRMVHIKAALSALGTLGGE